MHPNKHREIHLIFTWKSEIRWQCKFLLSSLDKLVKGSDEFPIMQRRFPEENKRQLLLKKGIYPYEYMDSFDFYWSLKEINHCYKKTMKCLIHLSDTLYWCGINRRWWGCSWHNRWWRWHFIFGQKAFDLFAFVVDPRQWNDNADDTQPLCCCC